MEFLAAMKTIRRMNEQCACGAGQQIETGKPLCPLYTTAFPCTDIFLYTDDSIIEKIIQKWDAENPEPQCTDIPDDIKIKAAMKCMKLGFMLFIPPAVQAKPKKRTKDMVCGNDYCELE